MFRRSNVMECRCPLGSGLSGTSLRWIGAPSSPLLRSHFAITRHGERAQLNGDKSQVSGRIAISGRSVVSWSDRRATGSEPRHVSGRGTRPSPRDRIPAHPTRFERVTFALGALLPPAPRPAKAVPVSLAQWGMNLPFAPCRKCSSAFALMQSNDAVDGVQFGWLD